MNKNWPFLLDSHCHVDFQEFDADRISVLERCFDLGVRAIVIPGVSSNQWPKLSLLCESDIKKSPRLYFACGTHPWWSENNSEFDEKAFQQCLNHSRCVAIGECGLDFHKDLSKSRQLEVFEWHLRMSIKTGKPLIIHCVKAHNELSALLKHYNPPAGGVIHAFSGSLQQAQMYWDMGFYLGIGATITYDRARKTRKAASEMPLESLLLETDAPAMPLQGHQGERNSPEQIVKVAQCLSELREEKMETVTQQTCRNAEVLFQLPQ